MPFDGRIYEGRIHQLEQIGRVIALLGKERRWCKGQLHTYDGRHCIVGALMEVGAMELRKPILLAIEQVTGHDVEIEYFNDHSLTTHSRVMQVLRQARQNVLDRSIESKSDGALARLKSVLVGVSKGAE